MEEHLSDYLHFIAFRSERTTSHEENFRLSINLSRICLEILELRFAKGEITKEECEEMKKTLEP